MLDRDTLRELVTPALEAAFTPCAVDDVAGPAALTVASGELGVRAEGRAPLASGSVGAVVLLSSNAEERRIPVRVHVSCPPPVVGPRSPVQIVAIVGNVRASAPGEARQPGREGDIIQVLSRTTRTSLRARVLDAQTVEVVQ